DHALFAQGLAGLIQQDGLAKLVVIAASVEAATDCLVHRQGFDLVLLAQGFPNKRICQSLDLTEHTVKTHLKAIFTQLAVHNRTECVNKARRLGWL
ncbi:MAG: LuxR C-terminal-related transcriptional regulator, partial [Marinobacter sp.]